MTKFEFSDKWNSRTEYLEFLRLRLREFRRLLKESGLFSFTAIRMPRIIYGFFSMRCLAK